VVLQHHVVDLTAHADVGRRPIARSTANCAEVGGGGERLRLCRARSTPAQPGSVGTSHASRRSGTRTNHELHRNERPGIGQFDPVLKLLQKHVDEPPADSVEVLRDSRQRRPQILCQGNIIETNYGNVARQPYASFMQGP